MKQDQGRQLLVDWEDVIIASSKPAIKTWYIFLLPRLPLLIITFVDSLEGHDLLGVLKFQHQRCLALILGLFFNHFPFLTVAGNPAGNHHPKGCKTQIIILGARMFLGIKDPAINCQLQDFQATKTPTCLAFFEASNLSKRASTQGPLLLCSTTEFRPFPRSPNRPPTTLPPAFVAPKKHEGLEPKALDRRGRGKFKKLEITLSETIRGCT